ncbi:hypothetical protein GCM10007939_08730 [Amylibacter marinus]|uniref:Diguanylate cyclase/phosphodiesterase n=1 Tax=Amylibacter marinus TaxID=1475483 RepID=A0ABQ5VTC5_9RHOB|nr:bifunctional diguanylate cyclase/phosphodiesterase [Amylibacter marinus]GLQ34590.1 hypothetical protein GCM10007939_08730 [Amylibacter marinus]
MQKIRNLATPVLAHQIGILFYVWRRDVVLRIGIELLFFASILAVLPVWVVASLVIGIIWVEVAIYRMAIPFAQKRYLFTEGFGYQVEVINMVHMLLLATPALLFIATTNHDLRSLGGLWIIFLAIYSTTSTTSIPRFYWMNFVIASAALAISTVIMFQFSQTWLDDTAWGSLLIFSAVFAVHGIKFAQRQQATAAALWRAKTLTSASQIEQEFPSHCDALTGLSNRNAFDEKLRAITKDTGRNQGDLAMFRIRLSHPWRQHQGWDQNAYDHALFNVSSRLMSFCKSKGFAARFDKDDFAVILWDIRTDRAAVKLGRALADLLDEPIAFFDRNIHVVASIGIARSKAGKMNQKELCSSAEFALDSLLGSETDDVAIIKAPEQSNCLILSELEEIDAALKNGEFEPYYQPKIDMLTGQIIGFEALARWHHPDRGVLLPAEFLPKLHEFDRMRAFTFAITQRVLLDIQAWQLRGLDPRSVSVNLDEGTLVGNEGLADLFWLLEDHKAAAKLLTLEISEKVIVQQEDQLIQNALRQFVDMGMRISMDDFGTGFAAFRYLSRLPLDELKIDTQFVTSIGQDPNAIVKIEGFLAIAAQLGVMVVAEGVETPAQRAFLLERGCNIGQGFLFFKPKQFGQITKVLREQNAAIVVPA